MHRVAQCDFTLPALGALSGDGMQEGLSRATVRMPLERLLHKALHRLDPEQRPRGPPCVVPWAQEASEALRASCHFPAGEHLAKRLFSEPVNHFFLGESFCNIAS